MAFLQNGSTIFPNNANTITSAGLVMNGEFGSITVQTVNPAVGTNAGFVTGGVIASPQFTPSPSSFTLSIDRFPFSSDTNATNVGSLSVAQFGHGAHSSETHGYTSGGYSVGTNRISTIYRFPFSTSTSTSSVGALTAGRYGGQGTSSPTHGFQTSSFPNSTGIDKFAFAASSSSFLISSLPIYSSYAAHCASDTRGYTVSGLQDASIQSFSFTNDNDVVDTGVDHSYRARGNRGASSTTHGYSAGGISYPTGTYVNTITKFPFASSFSVSTVGALLNNNAYVSAGLGSSTHGYIAGGFGPSSFSNTIQKFPFSTDTNATDVGDLTVARYYGSGHQD